MSVPLQLLASGASAEIFLRPEGRVLKLLRQGFPAAAAPVEYALARKAQAFGLPVPQVHALVEHEGRAGLVMDYCEGPTWLQLLEQGHPDPAGLGRAFFELQRRIHACDSSALLPLQPGLARQIKRARDIPEDLRTRLVGLAQEKPLRVAACHGDFHPMNVIATAQGPRIVDWSGMGWGDPAIDINRTLLHLRFAEIDTVTAADRAAFVGAYQDACRQAWQGRLDELRRWQSPMAVVRLTHASVDPGERRDIWRVALGEDDLWAEAVPS